MCASPMTIRPIPLAAADPLAVEALLDAAFGPDRHTRTAYRIREGMAAIAALSFAVFEDGRLVGSLQSWPVALDELPMILVGPVAVSPEAQRGGIGKALMTALLEAEPRDPLVMIGDPEYYGRFFEFSADATQGWSVPGPVERHRLLSRFDADLPIAGALGPRGFALAGSNA
jgi:predicted N-acetyltransferase YhbS